MESDLKTEKNKQFLHLNTSIDTIGNFLLICFFCITLTLFLFLNLKTLNKSLSEQWKKEGAPQEKLLLVEKDFQEKVYKRTEFINLYGLTLNTLNLKMVGDFDFVKDSHNIIQRFGTKTAPEKFLKNMNELKDRTDKLKIPLIYVALPDKSKYLELSESEKFCFEGQMSKQIGKQLGNTIDCVDIDALMSQEIDAPSFEELYFKTDVHCSTYGEFWIAKMLANHLQTWYMIRFPNAQQVFDLLQYDIKKYEFVGGTARSAGEYFVGTDIFEIYRPKFKTNLDLINPSADEKRSGPFEYVMLNGYESNPNINKYTYLVTDYGRFTSPYYQYINNNVTDDSPNLLVISDSVFMRGISYLALACKSLTVLDPRYFGGTEYVAQALDSQHYDAVVVVGSGFAYFNTRFQSSLGIPDLPVKTMISQEEYGKWIANAGICLDNCNDNQVGEKTDIQLDKNAVSVKLYGWAVDFCNDAPFKELYLQIGDITAKCEYGIERTGVVDHFKKDSLLKTGFRVEFPATYLQDAPDAEIAFIGVSANGQYRYQPVTYRLHRS